MRISLVARSLILGGVVCLVGAAPNAALAQTPATTWEEFMPLMKAGQSIQVIDRQGRRETGRVERVTASGLDLAARGNQRRTLLADDIVRVIAQDSNREGMLLGLLGGVGAGFVIGRSGCRGDSSCSAAQLAVGLPVGAGVGLLVGYLIDANSRRTLLSRTSSGTVTVMPIVDRRHFGEQLAVRW